MSRMLAIVVAAVGGVLLALGLALPAIAAGIQPSTELAHAGQVKLGDRVQDGQVGWQRLDDAAMEADLHCAYYANRQRLPDGVTAMVHEGVVVRFDLGDDQRAGPFGVRVGEREAVARARLPEDAVVSTHAYGEEPGDHYLTWRDPADGRALRVETTAGTVGSLYWGEWDAVQLIEGCL